MSVTEKLLTGYDAPILATMYLDKPLKDHTLLQAIARINRPYPNKEDGLVVDYIGIFEDLQKALAFDQASVNKALINLDELKDQFAGLMDTLAASLAPLNLADTADRPGRIIEHFADPEQRDDFMRLFKTGQTAYEVISPDPYLSDYIEPYTLYATVYLTVYQHFDPQHEQRKLRHELLAKTDAMIRQNLELVSLSQPLPLYPISKDIAALIAADNMGDQVKVINLYRSLITHIETHQTEQPYLAHLADQVEAIIQRLRERQISVETALAELQTKATETVAVTEAQQQSDQSGPVFAYCKILQAQGLPQAEATALAQKIEETLGHYESWPYNPNLERQARLALYRLLHRPMSQGGATLQERPAPYAAGQPDSQAAHLKTVVDNLLKMHRRVRQ